MANDNNGGLLSSYGSYFYSSVSNSLQSVIKKVGGNFSAPPSALETTLSPEVLKFIDQCFEDINETLIDHHTHVIGIGAGDTGCCVHSSLRTGYNPLKRIKYNVFLSACDVHTEDKADEEFIQRLRDLILGIRPRKWGRHFILGFDAFHDQDGRRMDELTGLYTPNEYISSLCKKYPDEFLPCISVHPYRKDALEELEKWARKGAKMVKWLPNAMGIDPSHELCEKYYEVMEDNKMVLLSHVGTENSVDAGGCDQSLGNPLLLRRPLLRGVRVIAAHCASEGTNRDLDSSSRPLVANFELWKRLMNEDRFNHLLYADISSTTLFRRIGALPDLLENSQWHSRLVNGSDYPVPAINIVIHTSSLQKMNLITQDQKQILDQIYAVNPLLFDYCLKRSLKSSTGKTFAPSIFGTNPDLADLIKPFED